MKMTFRWFGANSDPVSLQQIRQIPGMTGVMGFLDYKEAGEVWTREEIGAYVKEIQNAGLECEVIESVNVHEDIKIGLPTRDRYIQNYITTIRNLAEYGVKVIVYNFMPVFDWLRTDLHRMNPADGSYSMYYDEREIQGVDPLELVRNTISNANGFSLPGWEPNRLAELEETLNRYKNIAADDLRANYKYFLDAVIPVCEECGIVMACHSDDPAWNIFGLPRIAHSVEDFEKIVQLHDSPSNAICICTGSLGSDPKNDLPAMIRHFGKMNRVGCAHVRNIKHFNEREFCETAHLSSEGDIDMYEVMKAIYETCPDIYIRPDHGRMVWGEEGRPGYGLYDRAMGACYLSGIWESLQKG